MTKLPHFTEHQPPVTTRHVMHLSKALPLAAIACIGTFSTLRLSADPSQPPPTVEAEIEVTFPISQVGAFIAFKKEEATALQALTDGSLVDRVRQVLSSTFQPRPGRPSKDNQQDHGHYAAYVRDGRLYLFGPTGNSDTLHSAVKELTDFTLELRNNDGVNFQRLWIVSLKLAADGWEPNISFSPHALVDFYQGQLALTNDTMLLLDKKYLPDASQGEVDAAREAIEHRTDNGDYRTFAPGNLALEPRKYSDLLQRLGRHLMLGSDQPGSTTTVPWLFLPTTFDERALAAPGSPDALLVQFASGARKALLHHGGASFPEPLLDWLDQALPSVRQLALQDRANGAFERVGLAWLLQRAQAAHLSPVRLATGEVDPALLNQLISKTKEEHPGVTGEAEILQDYTGEDAFKKAQPDTRERDKAEQTAQGIFGPGLPSMQGARIDIAKAALGLNRDQRQASQGTHEISPETQVKIDKALRSTAQATIEQTLGREVKEDEVLTKEQCGKIWNEAARNMPASSDPAAPPQFPEGITAGQLSELIANAVKDQSAKGPGEHSPVANANRALTSCNNATDGKEGKEGKEGKAGKEGGSSGGGGDGGKGLLPGDMPLFRFVFQNLARYFQIESILTQVLNAAYLLAPGAFENIVAGLEKLHSAMPDALAEGADSVNKLLDEYFATFAFSYNEILEKGILKAATEFGERKLSELAEKEMTKLAEKFNIPLAKVMEFKGLSAGGFDKLPQALLSAGKEKATTELKKVLKSHLPERLQGIANDLIQNPEALLTPEGRQKTVHELTEKLQQDALGEVKKITGISNLPELIANPDPYVLRDFVIQKAAEQSGLPPAMVQALHSGSPQAITQFAVDELSRRGAEALGLPLDPKDRQRLMEDPYVWLSAPENRRLVAATVVVNARLPKDLATDVLDGKSPQEIALKHAEEFKSKGLDKMKELGITNELLESVATGNFDALKSEFNRRTKNQALRLLPHLVKQGILPAGGIPALEAKLSSMDTLDPESLAEVLATAVKDAAVPRLDALNLPTEEDSTSLQTLSVALLKGPSDVEAWLQTHDTSRLLGPFLTAASEAGAVSATEVEAALKAGTNADESARALLKRLAGVKDQAGHIAAFIAGNVATGKLVAGLQKAGADVLDRDQLTTRLKSLCRDWAEAPLRFGPCDPALAAALIKGNPAQIRRIIEKQFSTAATRWQHASSEARDLLAALSSGETLKDAPQRLASALQKEVTGRLENARREVGKTENLTAEAVTRLRSEITQWEEVRKWLANPTGTPTPDKALTAVLPLLVGDGDVAPLLPHLQAVVATPSAETWDACQASWSGIARTNALRELLRLPAQLSTVKDAVNEAATGIGNRVAEQVVARFKETELLPSYVKLLQAAAGQVSDEVITRLWQDFIARPGAAALLRVPDLDTSTPVAQVREALQNLVSGTGEGSWRHALGISPEATPQQTLQKLVERGIATSALPGVPDGGIKDPQALFDLITPGGVQKQLEKSLGGRPEDLAVAATESARTTLEAVCTDYFGKPFIPSPGEILNPEMKERDLQALVQKVVQGLQLKEKGALSEDEARQLADYQRYAVNAFAQMSPDKLPELKDKLQLPASKEEQRQFWARWFQQSMPLNEEQKSRLKNVMNVLSGTPKAP